MFSVTIDGFHVLSSDWATAAEAAEALVAEGFKPVVRRENGGTPVLFCGREVGVISEIYPGLFQRDGYLLVPTDDHRVGLPHITTGDGVQFYRYLEVA